MNSIQDFPSRAPILKSEMKMKKIGWRGDARSKFYYVDLPLEFTAYLSLITSGRKPGNNHTALIANFKPINIC